MIVFDPSKMKFFKKDGDVDGEQDVGEVKTFFDTLNLKGGGGGKSEKEEPEIEEPEIEEDEDDYDEDDDSDEEEENKLSPELIAMQKQLEDYKLQNTKLMNLLEKKDSSDEEEASLENPFENESFDNLAKTMDWDDDERKAMKAFMQNALDFQSQVTLTSATGSIDSIINSKMSQIEKKKAVQKQFFTENPKLKPVKDYVSTAASGILKEYQSLGKPLNPAEILKEAATRTYKALGIDPKVKGKDENESERDHNPAFPSMKVSSKKRNQKVNKTTTQKMITSMIDL